MQLLFHQPQGEMLFSLVAIEVHLQLLCIALQIFFSNLALRNIADKGVNDALALDGVFSESQFCREFRTILAQRGKLDMRRFATAANELIEPLAARSA